MQSLRIVVRGGGDLATGVIHRLWRAGFTPLVLECAHPAAIRRQVALCEAVYAGRATVEGMTGVYVVDGYEKTFVPVRVLIEQDGMAIIEAADDSVKIAAGMEIKA